MESPIRLLTVREVARLLGCPTNTQRVRGMIKQGLLKGIRVGRETRVPETSWNAWVNSSLKEG